MEITSVMECLVDFLAKRQEILCPAYASTEVGIVGIDLEPNAMSQAIEHRIYHILQLDEEAAINANMAHQSPAEGLIDPPIGCYIQWFHINLLEVGCKDRQQERK